MPEAGRTRRLVPAFVGALPSRFKTPLLREALKFALCAGGAGLSQADQGCFMRVMRMAEKGGAARPHRDIFDGVACQRRKRPRLAAGDFSGDESSEELVGEILRAFQTKSGFVAAVRGKQRRVLSKLLWDETPLEVEGARYLLYSRDLLLVAFGLLQNAAHVELWGEQLGVGPDSTRMRSCMLSSDVFLTEQAHARARYGSRAFVLALQLFVDEAVVSWSGAHYVYPIRARVLNVRDRAVQWVTVGYIPHVGKEVARTAPGSRRASDTRNGILQRCLAILLRRFVGASRQGVPVELPGRQELSAVPPLVGVVADQLGERSVMCLMGSACDFFCSHCVVHRDAAEEPEGFSAPARDVLAMLDAQLEGAVVRDLDPRPSLRAPRKTQHSALAFVPAIGAVWGLTTNSKQLQNIFSFDLLHV
eukprot:TRINITY_DN2569_c0_g1_i13.p1 TRINITY_DN2569_c0_g1~~TRINITY_DN2569_c0_g1_i13.p1  ORF type:complete len:419 (+),score=35.52 TRINITY_DN2569_c0_g1_i13:888-2144(+)